MSLALLTLNRLGPLPPISITLISFCTSISVEPVMTAPSMNAEDAVNCPPALTLKLLDDINETGSAVF